MDSAFVVPEPVVAFILGGVAVRGATQLIDLPYADEDSRRATNLYAAQCLAFTGEKAGRARYDRSDVLMASWFPEAYFKGDRGVGGSGDRVKYSFGGGWFPQASMTRPL